MGRPRGSTVNMFNICLTLLRGFCSDRHASVAPMLALLSVPMVASVGMAVDYSHASKIRTQLQAAIDSAVLSGARDGTGNWTQIAQNTFAANAAGAGLSGLSPVFSQDASGNFSGQLTARVDANIVGILGISDIPVSVRAVATGRPNSDDSCIFTLAAGHARSDATLVFNGAPSVSLQGCSLRSNASMTCNGHSGGAAASYGAGTVNGCSNPQPDARAVDDIYAALAKNISQTCGSLAPGITWSAGASPPASVQTVNNGSYSEYHICGDLTLQGNGTLSTEPNSVIVVENGSVIISAKASIGLVQTALVMTGANQSGTSVTFPNGNGKSATLALSPPTDLSNPWHGIALYQDPALTRSTDFDWGPGAELDADGVVYLPNVDLVMKGNAASGNTGCTKFVTNTFTSNGNVVLNFSQSTGACTSLGMQQWSDTPVHLVQ